MLFIIQCTHALHNASFHLSELFSYFNPGTVGVGEVRMQLHWLNFILSL